MKPYLDFSEYLLKTFRQKVQKVSINAGLSCPNRDGVDGLKGGCTYCNNRSFSPGYTQTGLSVSRQVDEGIRFFARKYPSLKYIAYFQSYTNTYGNTDALINLYEEAIAHPDIVGIFVGTRPDCINEELLEYFSELNRKRLPVFLEYGVESTNDETLVRVKRGHDFKTSVETILRTDEKEIPCGAHLIIGLPGETEADFVTHIDRLNALPLTSIKFHQLQILKGTALGRDYLTDPESMKLFTIEEYIRTAALLLRHLRPDMYVDRFTSQAPKNLLLAPKWDVKNYVFTDKLLSYVNSNGFRQGDLFEAE